VGERSGRAKCREWRARNGRTRSVSSLCISLRSRFVSRSVLFFPLNHRSTMFNYCSTASQYTFSMSSVRFLYAFSRSCVYLLLGLRIPCVWYEYGAGMVRKATSYERRATRRKGLEIRDQGSGISALKPCSTILNYCSTIVQPRSTLLQPLLNHVQLLFNGCWVSIQAIFQG
jgi:hypothetical protein